MSKDWEFTFVAVLFQLILLILYATSSDYNDATVKLSSSDEEEFGTEPFYFYSMLQDVHAMMFIGFGFLMTFLRKYGFSALSLNFLLCAFSIQWGLYIFHQIPWLFGESPGVLHVTSFKLIDGDIATAVLLISFGALLGRTNPAQLLVLCFLELLCWAINFHLCVQYLQVVDVGGSILVHTFGAYFGLAVSFWIGAPQNAAEKKSAYHSDIFSMIGTLFLWLYWPSFNGYFANRDYYFMDRAFINTVLALCGSTAATFVASRVVKRGKFDMVHIQNATLAGGVAVGAAADLYLTPAGAVAVGLFAGTLSVLGFEYLSDWLAQKLNISDTCGVHNLHGMPGILGGIVSAVALAAADGAGHYVNLTHADYPFGGLSLKEQAASQIAAVGVTLAMAAVSGSISAFFIKFLTFPTHEFQDGDNFVVPAADKDYLRGTIRKQHFAAAGVADLNAMEMALQNCTTNETKKADQNAPKNTSIAATKEI